MTKVRFVLLLGLGFGAFAGPAYAEEPAVASTRLTQDDALAAFHAHGLERLLADAAVSAAEGDARAGAKLPNPNLTLEAGPVFNYTPCASCWRFQLSAALTDSGAVFELLSGKHGAKSDAGRAAIEAAQQDRAAMFRFLDAEVKQACIRVALAQARLRFATEQNGYWVQGLEVQKLRATQVIDEGALARFEVQKAAADQAVVDAAAELRLAQASLGYLLGARMLAPAYEIDAAVLDEHAPASLANATEESLRARAHASRAELGAADARSRWADAGLRVAERSRFPTVVLGGWVAGQGIGAEANTPLGAGGMIAVDLPVFYQQQGQVKSAQASTVEQHVRILQARARIDTEVSGAFAAVQTTRSMLDRSKAIAVAAKTSRDVLERQYNAGSAPIVDFLDAQRVYAMAKSDELASLAAYRGALVELSRAIGEDLT